MYVSAVLHGIIDCKHFDYVTALIRYSLACNRPNTLTVHLNLYLACSTVHLDLMLLYKYTASTRATTRPLRKQSCTKVPFVQYLSSKHSSEEILHSYHNVG